MDQTRPAPAPDAPDGVCGGVLLEHDVAAVPLGRRTLTRELTRVEVPEGARDAVAVVVSELLGNAVRHASPLGTTGLLLRWSVTRSSVDVEVVDGGGGPVRVAHAAPGDTGGRGMHLVETLSDAWGTADDGHGRRTVWARVTTAPSPPPSREVAPALGALAG